ncbi:peptidase S8/S53 domain-containing protein [Pilobolus umbonatus]|nr:peptidase S8/S53 domain-containing protein [Pilobolus umbonatus]
MIRAITVFLLLVSLAIQLAEGRLSKKEVKDVHRWFVEFNEGQSASHSEIIRSLNEEYSNANVILKRSFSHELFNGFSMEVRSTHGSIKESVIDSLLSNQDIKAIYPLSNTKRNPAKRSLVKRTGQFNNITQTHLLLSHKMTQVDRVHSELNVRGQGVLVGVIDDAFDYKHPALGGGIGPDHKIIMGYDFVGDNFEGATPDNDPFYECIESGAGAHGTHVAGIIAGEDPSTGYVGVAPDAKLAIWRSGMCPQGLSDEAIASALLMAYDAGVDIINMSLGGTSDSFAFYDYIIEKLTSRGINVVVAAGNEGRDGFFTVGEPGSTKSAYSVAAVNNDYEGIFFFTSESFPERYLIGTTDNVNIKGGPLAFPSGDDLCSPATIYPDDVKGSVVFVNATECVREQIAYLIEKGAGEILAYNSPGGLHIANLPIYDLQSGDLEVLFQHSGAIIKVDRIVVEKSNAQTITDFSSVGPTEYLEFKPNIAAPGGPVYSSIPRVLGSWVDMPGTSMASPYTAGVLALYKSYLKNHNVQYIEEHFQNHAHAMNVYNTSSLDSPLRQGAGLIQAYDALTQVNHISPAQISFNDTVNTAYHTQKLTITNNGHKDATYRLFNNVTVTILPYGDNADGAYVRNTTNSEEISAEIEVSHHEVKIAPGESETITVTVIPPTNSEGTYAIYGGFIQFDPIHQSGSYKNKAMHVPYIGVLANQYEVPIIDPTSTMLKLKLNDTVYESTDPIVLDESTPIMIEVDLVGATHILKFELLDAETEEVLGYLSTGNQNLTPPTVKSIFAGIYIPILSVNENEVNVSTELLYVPVKPGTYLLCARALKFSGNPENKEDWDVRVSVPIIVEKYISSYGQ